MQVFFVSFLFFLSVSAPLLCQLGCFLHFRLASCALLWYNPPARPKRGDGIVWSRGVRVAQEILILFVLVRIQARLSETKSF